MGSGAGERFCLGCWCWLVAALPCSGLSMPVWPSGFVAVPYGSVKCTITVARPDATGQTGAA
eukprot:XP_001691142.1 predicted protein [Chlamydomonas reinhardtii]